MTNKFSAIILAVLFLNMVNVVQAQTGPKLQEFSVIDSFKLQMPDRLEASQFQMPGWHEAKDTHFEQKSNIYVMLDGTLVINDTGGDCIPEIMGNWDGLNLTCTLTKDLNAPIQIKNNSITLDGSGHIITGSGTGSGVYLYVLTGVTVKNLNVNNFSEGIRLFYSSDNTLENNNVSNNYNGIYLESSNSNTLTNNKVSYSDDGINIMYSSGNTLNNNDASNNYYTGINIYYGYGNTLNNNDASNNYYTGIDISYGYFNILNSNIVSYNGPIELYDLDSGGIMLRASGNNIISGNTVLNNNITGIFLGSSSDNTLSNNNASNNNFSGIMLAESSNNTLNSNFASHNGIFNMPVDLPPGGISLLFKSDNNTLSGNTAMDNGFVGFFIGLGSSNNTLSGNNASKNIAGIYLGGDNNDTISSNNASNNFQAGIYVEGCNDITISNNIASNNNPKGFEISEAPMSAGIVLIQSINNKIINNIASNNHGEDSDTAHSTGSGFGIFLGQSDGNLLGNNIASNNSGSGSAVNPSGNASGYGYGYGISLFQSSENMLDNNTASDNYGYGYAKSKKGSSYGYGYGYGIGLVSSSGNLLANNTASDNSGSSDADYRQSDGFGVSLKYSSDNRIYNNYFNNPTNAEDDGVIGINTWNITETEGTNIIGGPYMGGNFWSDYRGIDINGDGLGDTLIPCNSSGKIIYGGDYLPLAFPFKVTKDFRDGVVDFGKAQLGALLPQNGSDYNVSYVLTRKGMVSGTSPKEVFGVITIEGTGTANVTVNDTFSTASGNTQFIVSPAKLVGGVEIIRYSTSTGVATILTTTTQITSASVNNTAQTVNLTIQLDTPLASDEKLMVYVKFATALKGMLPNKADFVNEAVAATNLGTPKTATATVNFV